MAAEAIGLHVELEVLDPVLALPAPGVKLVKLLRICAPGGNEEAGVSPLLHRLGLVDDPALMLPASGLVETFREELHLLPFAIVVEGRNGEAGVGPQLDGDLGPSLPQATDDAPQQGHRGVG